jgi:acetyl esterase/lipase
VAPDLRILFVPDGPDAAENAQALGRLTGAHLVCAGYRPTFPAAFEDVRAAYRQACPAVVIGERMGASLAAALLVDLRDRGAALPRCSVLVSGLLDLTMRSASLALHVRTDAGLDVNQLRQRVAEYAGGATLTDPLLSPLYANLHGLTPVQLLVAGTDPLLDDSLGFASRAARSGVSVDLRVSPDAYTLHSRLVPTVAEFITAALSTVDAVAA